MIIQHLIADQFGSHIGKYSKRLKITQGKIVLAEAPLLHLQSLTISNRGVSISADAIDVCCECGIPIVFLSSFGRPYASLYASGLTGTVRTRREQLLAYYDERGCQIACVIAATKIQNQANTLKYFAKNRKETFPDLHAYLHDCAITLEEQQAPVQEAANGVIVEAIRASIMGIEGHAARIYWQAIGEIVPESYCWNGRIGRGATDPLNSLLNYGYGILYSRIEQAIILAGLDPYAGFLHADRAGKPSLVLDLIEEFRQIVIDRLVVGLATRHYKIEQDNAGRLADDFRAAYAEKVIAHLETTTRYHKKRYPLRYIIQNQARHLASYLRGDTAQYVPFQATW